MINPISPRIDILLEEESAQIVLRRLAPGILAGADVEVRVLLLPGIKSSRSKAREKLEARLRSYAGMIKDGHNIGVMILIDRDQDDCKKLKQELESVSKRVGLNTKTSPRGDRFHVVNRIAVEELEAWYFGDPAALKAAYPQLGTDALQKHSRAPDAIKKDTKEKFLNLLEKAGYYHGHPMQMDIADRISPHMQPDINTSPSFNHFVEGMKALAKQLLSP